MKNLIINYVYNDTVTSLEVKNNKSYWYTTIS